MNGCHQSSLKSGISYGCRVSRKMVAIHSSGTGLPACFRMAMIWLSVKRDVFM
jgi:hypothetical protein